MFAALLEHYRTIFGLSAYGAGLWGLLARHFVVEAGGVILAGTSGAVFLFRRHGYLLCGAGISGALWWLSVGYTSGGITWSMRVLTPAFFLLAVAAGVAIARCERRSRVLPRIVSVAILALLLHGAARGAAFPYDPSPDWRQFLTDVSARVEAPPPQSGLDGALTEWLAPGTRILGDDAYAHALLANTGAHFELVPVWSPEVAFLFDATVGPSQQRALLHERNIDAVLICRSANTSFCMRKSPFYEGDLPRWKLRGASQEDCRILVPPE